MCLIRFQQLPPPAAGNFSFDQNAADRLALKVYGDMMVDRFYQLSGPDINEGGIILSCTTIGYGGVESMCNAGIEPERFCDERLMNSSNRWPQAITGFKLTNETGESGDIFCRLLVKNSLKETIPSCVSKSCCFRFPNCHSLMLFYAL
jgi:hypothetical protein